MVVWCLSACEGNLSTFVSLSGTNGLSCTESLETSCDERDSQSGRAAKRHSLGFAEWKNKKKMKIIISTACPNQLGRGLKDIFILWRSFLTSLAWKIRAGNSRRGLKKKKKRSEMTRGQRAAVGIFRTCSWLRIYRLFSLMLSKSGSWYQKRAGHTCRERGAVVVTSDLNVF